MKKYLPKALIATGFFTLLGMLCFVIVVVIMEYNLLSKEHVSLYQSKNPFPLTSCESPQKSVRTFSVNGKKASSVPILTYHRIVKKSNMSKQHYIDGEINPMVVSKEMFAKQMAYLKNNDFVTLTLSELFSYLTEELDIPEKSVVLTFDDGYKDNYIEAYPLLKEYDFFAVNFLITGAVTKRVHLYTPKHVQYFSTKELRNACDVFDYQSHTYNYHRLEENAQNEEVAYLHSKSTEEVREDIQKSIHNLNGKNLAFAYPYGEYNPSTITIIKELGFKMAFTTEDRAATKEDHLYEIPRFNILATTEFEQFKDYVNSTQIPRD